MQYEKTLLEQKIRLVGIVMFQMKEMNARLENVQTGSSISDVHHNICRTTETESPDTNEVRKMIKQKIGTRDMSLLAGMLDFISHETLS
jgi:hypothetical protein